MEFRILMKPTVTKLTSIPTYTTRLMLPYGLTSRIRKSRPIVRAYSGTKLDSSLQGYQFYLNGMGFSGKNGVPKGLGKDSWLNFGPRLGFAYDLLGTGKTIVRGGFGIMYERIQGNDMYNGATNPPFGYSLGVNNVLLSNPHENFVSNSAITVPIVPGSVVGINQSYPAPRTSQYSAGVQQALGARTVLSVSYVGTLDRQRVIGRKSIFPRKASCHALPLIQPL